MSRKYILIAGILLLGTALVACRGRRDQDSSEEMQQNPDITQEVTPSVTEITLDPTKQQGISRKQDTEQDTNSVDQPAATGKPGNHSNPDNQSNPGNQSDLDNQSNSEGDAKSVSGQNKSELFYYEEIPEEVKTRIEGKSYGKDCDVPYDELRYVRVLYWGFDEETHKGELIVNQSIAEDIVEIMKELYDQKYPIERMVLVDEYDADDNTSMAADNTSSFNYRKVDGTDHLSLHSYGLAIDINPLYNPYVRGTKENQIITPLNGTKYADRSRDCAYYIKKDDVCYQAFIKRGFTWGGEWKSQKDYQHFQKKPE